MAAVYSMVDADWSIERSTGNIRYEGEDHNGTDPSYATVIQFHRWLQAWADDASSSGDDEHDITDTTSSERSTDNIITLKGIYNITAAEAEHLYDGSIVQGAVGVDQMIWDGIVNFGNADVQIQVIQDGAVISDDYWNYDSAGLNPNATAGISHRFMLLVHDYVGSGGDIDGRRLIGTCRRFGKTYSEFKINGTSRGNNVLALGDATDLNNATAEGTVSGWTSITNTTEGYVGIDVNDNSADEYYFSEWNTNQPTQDINDFYERMKWLTREGSASTLYGLNGELFRGITHELDVDGGSGTWGTPEHEEITWGTGATAGTAQLIAVDNKTGTSTSKIWFQMLTGVVPTDNETITGTTSSADCLAEMTGGSLTERTISTPFVGVSTGSALIGAYGVGVEYLDLANTDTVFDLSNDPWSPPNNQSFAVYGLEAGEDRIIVTNDQSTGIDYDQFVLSGAHTASQGTVTITTSIPTDTPATGTIRIFDGTTYARVTYTGWSGSAFTGCTGCPDALDAADVFITYIDKLAASDPESVTMTYSAARTMFVRVRDGGGTPIKTAETTGSFGSGGGSATVNRISDE